MYIVIIKVTDRKFQIFIKEIKLMKDKYSVLFIC